MLTLEQIKSLISYAIEHRSKPPYQTSRAKYFFWINLFDEAKNVYCTWTRLYKPAEGQLIVHTAFQNLDEGFTAEEWNTIAQKFVRYFTERTPHV